MSKRCQERVFHPGMFSDSPCVRAATVDGKWCKQHDPERVKAKRAERDRAWNEKYAAMQAKGARAAAQQRALLDCARAISAFKEHGTAENRAYMYHSLAAYLASGGRLEETP